MCERCARDKGWSGWFELPESSRQSAAGQWLDLSHPWSSAMPRQPFFPEPSFKHFMQAPEHPLNVTHLDMIVHIGTHVDAPRHVFNDGPAFEDIPLERLNGPGVVWRIEPDENGFIGPEQLDPALSLLEPGDMLLLNTGMYRLAYEDGYADHPSLSLEGAQWLIDHRVKLLGVDMPTPELAHHRRPPGFDFPVHRLLLAHGVLIAEHLTNLDKLSNQKVEVICNALNIVGGDGAPCRILARAR